MSLAILCRILQRPDKRESASEWSGLESGGGPMQSRVIQNYDMISRSCVHSIVLYLQQAKHENTARKQ